MFNSRQYEWADLALYLGGVDITGIRGLTYTKARAKSGAYAKGSYAHSIQRGNYEISGEIMLLQSELENLTAAAPGRDILRLNLLAVVSYGGNIENGATAVITDHILSLEFTEVSKSIQQGDPFMEVTLPFIALRVENQR